MPFGQNENNGQQKWSWMIKKLPNKKNKNGKTWANPKKKSLDPVISEK